MLDEARALWQPRMVLVEPFVVPVTEAQERWGVEDLDEKREVVASLATEFAAAFVPLHTIMTIAAKGEGAASPRRGRRASDGGRQRADRRGLAGRRGVAVGRHRGC